MKRSWATEAAEPIRDEEAMIDHLVASRLAGSVDTSVRNTRSKIRGMFDGDPRCTFGLSLCSTATMDDVERALRVTARATLSVPDEELGYIDPRSTLDGMDRYAAMLGGILSSSGLRIVLATGHPAGLLDHYTTLARELERRGHTLLRPYDDGPAIATDIETEQPPRTVRFVGPVGCVYSRPGSLSHSHLSVYMDAMLDAATAMGQEVDVVIGDHGMAGAAIERGVPVLSIADVNDIPLQLAHLAGRNDGLLVIDDNLPSQLFRPVTAYILAKALAASG
jgi:hypothetical protein